MPKVDRPIYELHLRPEPGIDAIRALRAVLKVALRQFGLRCVSIDAHLEEHAPGGTDDDH